MRTPTWETSAGALVAFLNSTTQCWMADLYTITLQGGGVMRYSNADVGLTVNGNTFGKGPVISRSGTKLTVGISVDSLSFTMAADQTVTVNGTPMLQFIAAGGLDGAVLTLERAFCAAPNSAIIGTINMFSGRISDVQVSRYDAQITVNSDSELLNTMLPRNVYQSGCGNTLFDTVCGLTPSAFSAAATATTISDIAQSTFATGLAQASGYFDTGYIIGVTGGNAGVMRTIKSFAVGIITTIQPWPAMVNVGDTFTAYAGCDKTQATCTSKFSNVVHFRGYPYVPAPESVT